MVISGNIGASANSQSLFGVGQAADSCSRAIQKQIENVRRQLQELSSNGELSMEEKMKKRQELQQEIADLNNQLRAHQMEVRRQAQKKSENSMDDMLCGNRQPQKESTKAGTGLSAASMQAVLSADNSMRQVQTQSQVKTGLEGRAGVLKAEIKQDAGGNTEAKEAELADVEERANNVISAQMSALSDMHRSLEKVAEEDGSTDSEQE
ncbi:MAG: FlxA-like family protein [Clostridiaceae bacterium]|nr:FlxA-like family protein [Clostridiaceae bacterium]